MSRRTSTVLESADALAVIREEQGSPATSNVKIDAPSKDSVIEPEKCPEDCSCQDAGGTKFSPEEVERMLKEKENTLRTEFADRLEKDTKALKEQFDFILQHEQIRTSYMLREAHRERQEKMQALQTQLQCKNMAGLMYVLCSERRKSKLEKLRIIEEDTNYIRALQDILTEGQQLILRLSRGYKTAARVDQEWRDKMTMIIKEFQEYVYHFAGGTPETNQFIFDIPALLKIEASTMDDPLEDPCDCVEEEQVTEVEPEKTWWERLDGEDRPFVMFGDMADFRPNQRREVLKAVKAAKTAPRKWKEYVFHEMFLKADCSNVDAIKDEYPKRLSVDRFECRAPRREPTRPSDSDKMDESRRPTSNSVELTAAMGSILKLITASCITTPAPVKANLLGARDSMEIASATRVRERTRDCTHQGNNRSVSISIAGNKESLHQYDDISEDSEMLATPAGTTSKLEDELDADSKGKLGSIHQDSLQVLHGHVPDIDHNINYEKICPMEKCQRMQVDSFMRSLPAYVRASPFTHFEHTFEDYETCSPEQLKLLKQRLEERKVSHHRMSVASSMDWTPSVEGVGVQTSSLSLYEQPSCTCRAPNVTPKASGCGIFNVEDLLPMKEALDHINKECFFDTNIEFNRFKVIGERDSNTMCYTNVDKKDFKGTRADEITRILKRHPSMLDLFQGNTRC